ncbi:MFS transporter [Dictyobacter formicarum]|uniref:MFS transporter n=1 Tax=Dictyobacter formicarum TaxID=2778368 RepID=A0ABQ3VJR4_9CHLR|nr:MFS transporter [Dictyobacter formicarum]GHO86417.1 MFS transporter [Dictyobacter formicarum]
MKQNILHKDNTIEQAASPSHRSSSLQGYAVVPISYSRPSYLSIGSNICSAFLLRAASRLSFVLLGFYLGEHFSSATLVALVLEAFYISELALAPIAGSLSDRLGRKPFLLFAPVMGALASCCLLLAACFSPRPDASHIDAHLLLLLLFILCGRLLEGAMTALNAPACLGFITDMTVGSARLRARVMTAFEVATVGGLALGIPCGGQLSKWLGYWGFLVVIGLHVLNLLIVVFLIKESHHRPQQSKSHGSLMESVKLLRNKYIFTFLPAWLSVNTLVGAWITLLVIMLTYPNPAADLRHPHQLLYGGFGKDIATLALGGFGLFFLAGMGVWMLILPRLRRTTVMIIGLVGLGVCVIALTIINGLGENLSALTSSAWTALWILLPLVMLGVLLLSGFTPASLTQMASISERMAGKRGAVMGLYSVVLGLGQFIGASIGGLAVDLAGFYGLMSFSVILGILSLISVLYMRVRCHDLA